MFFTVLPQRTLQPFSPPSPARYRDVQSDFLSPGHPEACLTHGTIRPPLLSDTSVPGCRLCVGLQVQSLAAQTAVPPGFAVTLTLARISPSVSSAAVVGSASVSPRVPFCSEVPQPNLEPEAVGRGGGCSDAVMGWHLDAELPCPIWHIWGVLCKTPRMQEAAWQPRGKTEAVSHDPSR